MGAAATATPAVRPKELHFPLSVEWVAERRVVAQMEGKPTIEITPPPVFRGTDPTTSSPEDFFVVAAASCLAVTFAGLAATVGLTYAGLRVDGDGVVGLRADGRSGFTRLLPRFELDVDPAHEAQARDLAEKAEAGCLVSVLLDLPVETAIEVRTATSSVGPLALSSPS
ncbi:MAG TPA: OsmC family protein [Gaiellaceae bacterium]|nr:OsmC family protein [Gaiellaceae bacterium]